MAKKPTDPPADVEPLAALQSDHAKLQQAHQEQAAELKSLRREYDHLVKSAEAAKAMQPRPVKRSVRLVLARDTMLGDVPKGIGTPICELLLEPGLTIETVVQRIAAGDLKPAAT